MATQAWPWATLEIYYVFGIVEDLFFQAVDWGRLIPLLQWL